MLYFIKNNPEKLYDKYKSIKSDYIEDKKKKEAIIDRLIELKADIELLDIFSFDKKNQFIQNYLFEKYKENPEKLFWLYNCSNLKKEIDNRIISRLIKLDAEKELLKLFEIEKNNIQIQNYLFERYKDIPNKLYLLFQNVIEKQMIIDRLIELDAETHLIKIFKIIKDESIQNYLFKKYNNNPERLFWLYPKFKDKQKIIEGLVEIDAEEELFKLFEIGKNNIQIQNYLLKKYNNKPEELFWLYKHYNEKQEIIKKLIELNADDKLLSLLGITKNNEEKILISNFFIDKSNDINLLKNIFEINTNIIRKKVISKLLNLKAINELEKKYLNKGFNDCFLEQLLKSKNEKIKDILSLYNKIHSFKDKLLVVGRLAELKAEKELEIILNKNDCSEGLILYIVTCLISISSNSRILRDIYIKADMEQKQKVLNKLIILKAHNELKEIFNNSKNNKSLFSKLLSLNIIGDKEIIDYLVNNFINEIKETDELRLILSYINLLSNVDNPVSINTAIKNNFSYFFSEGIASDNITYLVLCSFIDNNMYNKSIQEIKDNFKICNDINTEKTKIKARYAELISDASTKKNVKELITNRTKEISKLFEKNIFEKIQEIYDLFNTNKELVKQQIFYGNSILTRKLLTNINIVSDLYDEEKHIKTDLLNKLQNLEDSDFIMKLKAKADKQINSLVSIKDFCYTIQELNPRFSDNEKYIHKLGKILIESKDVDLSRAILYFSAKSVNSLWINYIENISDNYDLAEEVFLCLVNKFSISNFKFFISIMSSNIELISGNSYELFIKHIKVALIEHLFYFIFNATANDLQELTKLVNSKSLNSLGEMKKPIKKIMNNILDNVGKESKVIEVTVGNNPESKDIEINK